MTVMLEKGFNYLLYEEKARITYELISELARSGSPVLCITTIFPKKLKKMYPLENAEILWLSDSGSDPKALKPTRLDFEITRSITNFFKNNEGAVVFLDGFEYLLSENGFDKARRFVKRINDTASITDGTFIICVNKDAIPKEDLITLSKDFDIVKEASELMDRGGESAPEPPKRSPAPSSAPASHSASTSPRAQPHPPPSPAPQPLPQEVSAPAMPTGGEFPLEIEDIYLIHRNAGILLQRKTWREKDVIDPDLVAGMFQGVLNFVNESFASGERSKFSRMDIKGYIILVYDSELVSLAIVFAGEGEEVLYRSIHKIRTIMQETAESIEKAYRKELEDYKGDVGAFKGTRKYLDYLALAIYDAMAAKPGEEVDIGPIMPEPEVQPEIVEAPIVTEAEDYMSKASMAARSGRYEEALKYFDEALRVQPNNLKALFNKAVMLQMLGRHAEAIKYYDEYLKINPYDPEAWSNKGMALRRMGRVNDAIECYEKGIELNPDDATLWSNKGIALRSMGRVDEAIKCYDRALEIDPNDAGIWSNKGVALQSIGRLEEAIKCYDRALEIDPHRRVPLQNREIALRQLRQRGRGLR